MTKNRYTHYKSSNFESKKISPFDARFDNIQSDNVDEFNFKNEREFSQNLNEDLNTGSNNKFNSNLNQRQFSKQDIKNLNDKKRLNREILLFFILLATLFTIIYIFQSLLNQQNFENL